MSPACDWPLQYPAMPRHMISRWYCMGFDFSCYFSVYFLLGMNIIQTSTSIKFPAFSYTKYLNWMLSERCMQAIYIVPAVYFTLNIHTIRLKSQPMQLIKVKLQIIQHLSLEITYQSVNKGCDQNYKKCMPEAPIWVFCTYHLTGFPTIEGSDGCILSIALQEAVL